MKGDPKKEQTETPTIAKGKSQVDNVFLSYTEIQSMAAAQIAGTTDQLVSK